MMSLHELEPRAVAAALERLLWLPQVLLMGSSQGGSVACDAALTSPQKVAGVLRMLLHLCFILSNGNLAGIVMLRSLVLGPRTDCEHDWKFGKMYCDTTARFNRCAASAEASSAFGDKWRCRRRLSADVEYKSGNEKPSCN